MRKKGIYRSAGYETLLISMVVFTLIFAFAHAAFADSKRGIDDKSVTIGISAPLSRLLAEAGQASVDCYQAYFKYVNEVKGGVNGRKIKLVVTDHQYEPSRSLANFKRLVVRDQAMAVISWGTPASTILIKPAMEEKVPLIAMSGGRDLYIPSKRYVVAFATPWEFQSVATVTYIIDKLGDKNPKIGLFYNNDDFGRSGKAGIELAAKHYGFEILSEAPHITGSPVDKAAVTNFKKAGVKYVMVGAHSGDVSSLLLEMKSQGLDCDVFGVLAPSSDPKIIEQAGEAAKRYHSVDQQGRWTDTKAPGIQQMIDITKKYGFVNHMNEKSWYYTSAWGPALMIEEALRRAGKDLTVEKFVDALDTFNNWETGDSNPPITLNPKRRISCIGSIIVKADLEQKDLLPVSGWIMPPRDVAKTVLGE
ncbi:MAG: ABC transporter substrate-binding protein [Syntrophorhabdales bacterium]